MDIGSFDCAQDDRSGLTIRSLRVEIPTSGNIGQKWGTPAYVDIGSFDCAQDDIYYFDLLWRVNAQVLHDHLEVFPGFAFLARVAEEECRMIGDR